MTKQEIAHIIKAIFKQIKKTVPSVVNNFEPDSIHKIRVQLKKLRAFLRLLSSALHEPGDLKLPKRLKEIYSAAGKVRSLQLQLSRINKIPKNKIGLPHYNNALETELEQKTEDLKNCLEEKNILAGEKKVISKIPEKIEEAVIIKFFQLKITDIKLIILLGGFSDQELHSIRKLIKDVIYVAKLLREFNIELMQMESLNETALLSAEKIAQQLGEYNDICSELQFLAPAYIDESNTQEKIKLESLRAKWDLQKNLRKADLTRALSASPIFHSIE